MPQPLGTQPAFQQTPLSAGPGRMTVATAPSRSTVTLVIGTSSGDPGLQAGEEAGAPRSGAMIAP